MKLVNLNRFSRNLSPLSIWLVGVSFVLFQFFLQLSSGVIINTIGHEMKLSAFATGILSSSFYYIYTSLQIPVGLLFDWKSTRFLLSRAALVCSIGCLLFSLSHQLISLIGSRLLIGAGAAFAFIGLSQLLRQHFPNKQFAFMIGLSETLGFIVTMFGIIGLGFLIQYCGWRYFSYAAAFVGLAIAACTCLFIPDNPCSPSKGINFSALLSIFYSWQLWLNGLFVGLSFTVITVFGAMWAIPFLEIKLHCSLSQASLMDAMLFLGAAISCPLFGYLTRLIRRRLLILSSCLITSALLFVVLFFPILGLWQMAFFMFLIGISCGAYMLAYSIANELAPIGALSTCTGFINTLAMLSAPLFQPWIGYLLDTKHGIDHSISLSSFQNALSIVPIGLCIAGFLVFFLPDKKPVG